MTIEKRENLDIARGDGVEVRTRSVEVAPATRGVVVSRVNQLIWLLTAVLVALIAFRFVLLLVGAGYQSGFAGFIYTVTNPFVAPFAGILNLPPLAEGSYFDVGSLFAAVAYVLLAWVIVSVIRIVFGTSGGVRQVQTVQRTGRDV